jgi:hypothetical protein
VVQGYELDYSSTHLPRLPRPLPTRLFIHSRHDLTNSFARPGIVPPIRCGFLAHTAQRGIVLLSCRVPHRRCAVESRTRRPTCLADFSEVSDVAPVCQAME